MSGVSTRLWIIALQQNCISSEETLLAWGLVLQASTEQRHLQIAPFCVLTRSCWRIHPPATRGKGANAEKREVRVCSRGRSSLQANRRTRLRAQVIITC